ncbi:hypothetical protein L195_g055945, partial [Trifolium pratense]
MIVWWWREIGDIDEWWWREKRGLAERGRRGVVNGESKLFFFLFLPV